VIGAINGHCVGGGLEVAMACDMRIGRDGTYKVGLPEVHLGVLPGTGGTQRLIRLLGKAKALELMVTGSNLSFAQGLDLGLFNQVQEADSRETFLANVVEYARTFCPPGRASKAVGLIKRAAQTGGDASMSVGLALERELQQQLFMSADAAEGIKAYNERRKPIFEGR
jgi:enoyl-CoA hydratase